VYAGYLEEGDRCRESGCSGVLAFPKAENCSCHISPPCHACTSVCLKCPECGWADESEPERFIPVCDGLSMLEHKPRPLDNTKVDYRCKFHSGASMIKEGVYPEGMAAAEVRKVVDGTFGGRFEQFGGGRFKFIAYTD
jgi:hypothetical protein